MCTTSNVPKETTTVVISDPSPSTVTHAAEEPFRWLSQPPAAWPATEDSVAAGSVKTVTGMARRLATVRTTVLKETVKTVTGRTRRLLTYMTFVVKTCVLKVRRLTRRLLGHLLSGRDRCATGASRGMNIAHQE